MNGGEVKNEEYEEILGDYNKPREVRIIREIEESWNCFEK